jgi:alkylated DNA nucleotide flippase Atl1
MLKPSRATIEAFINEIPEDRLVTTDLMRKELARWHGVEVTCPYDTRMVLQSIANDPQTQVPYWRVLKANGEINPNYPGGQQGHAVQIQAAGFNLETAGKVLRVSQYKHSLVQFD